MKLRCTCGRYLGTAHLQPGSWLNLLCPKCKTTHRITGGKMGKLTRDYKCVHCGDIIRITIRHMEPLTQYVECAMCLTPQIVEVKPDLPKAEEVDVVK